MIGKLKGIVDTLKLDHLIMDVGGVGYLVFASAMTLRALPKEGEAALLYIETHVREDHIHLYGFASQAEKEAFLTLLKVSGVGAKMALAILSVLTPQQIAHAVMAQDKKAFTQASGVGPKLAVRLVTELKDSFGKGVSLGAAPTSIASAKPYNDNSPLQDAISALVNLGYSREQAFTVIERVAARQPEGAALAVGALIREGLKELSVA
jgi:Holliday junction DNA helicase RuvA